MWKGLFLTKATWFKFPLLGATQCPTNTKNLRGLVYPIKGKRQLNHTVQSDCLVKHQTKKSAKNIAPINLLTNACKIVKPKWQEGKTNHKEDKEKIK